MAGFTRTVAEPQRANQPEAEHAFRRACAADRLTTIRGALFDISLREYADMVPYADAGVLNRHLGPVLRTHPPLFLLGNEVGSPKFLLCPRFWDGPVREWTLGVFLRCDTFHWYAMLHLCRRIPAELAAPYRALYDNLSGRPLSFTDADASMFLRAVELGYLSLGDQRDSPHWMVQAGLFSWSTARRIARRMLKASIPFRSASGGLRVMHFNDPASIPTLAAAAAAGAGADQTARFVNTLHSKRAQLSRGRETAVKLGDNLSMTNRQIARLWMLAESEDPETAGEERVEGLVRQVKRYRAERHRWRPPDRE